MFESSPLMSPVRDGAGSIITYEVCSMARHLNTPQFQNEAEEALWWDQNEELLFGEFERAAADGTLGHGTLAGRGLAEMTSVQLDLEDMEMARKQAAERGLRYQAYIKMVLHRALCEADAGERDRNYGSG